MRGSICRFMPAKDYSDSIKTVNFVYEAEFKKLRQPFLKPIFVLNLVTCGSGKLICENNTGTLEKGCIFFNFPGKFFEIEASDDFEFAYISFMGDNIDTFLEKFGINITNSIFYGFGGITELWLTSLRRLDEHNANILTESMLLYALSFFGNHGSSIPTTEKDNLFSAVLDYIDKHYSDPDISLGRVSGIFAYSQKYFSHIFKDNIGKGFCEYINDKRMNYALSLIESGISEVSKISEMCGFSDPLYFSKVFKKFTGLSPKEYIKNKR